MVWNELYQQFKMDHQAPKHPYPLDPDLDEEEEKGEFKLTEADLYDRKSIGLMLQEFVAWEHLKDMIEMGNVPKGTTIHSTLNAKSSELLKFQIKLPKPDRTNEVEKQVEEVEEEKKESKGEFDWLEEV